MNSGSLPHFTRNNAAFWCRGFLRLCFENLIFLAVFGQGKHGAISKNDIQFIGETKREIRVLDPNYRMEPRYTT
ncbi:hypothetical protein PFMALIP_05851 [Plasmodium falciparum MaliPS096_E11]|uniref:Uncharacterized protein n=1 Tax=Plasmodium falciparum MaliPS096_E11 TaxID=1036727 RepID=A0A024WGI2_PLAFA|nr:hypothetical protein PFMALIP_05851 [Plasmodium falciparum MaliPS096_E11]